jgi:putative cell wall-binding protein
LKIFKLGGFHKMNNNYLKRARAFPLLLLFILFQVLCFTGDKVYADNTSDGYVYTVSDAAATIIDYTGSDADITIPASLGGYPVIGIGEYAFYGCSVLNNVVIPSCVTNLGNYAFYDCYSLKSISLPAKLRSIGDYAFYNCSSLTSISIPSEVTGIGNYAFLACINLKKINAYPTIAPNAYIYSFANITSTSVLNILPGARGYGIKPWTQFNQKIIGISRISGSDRYATSVAVSKSAWTQAGTVIVVTGLNYPDALASSSLTKSMDAPILLSRTDSMDANVVDEIQRLKATKAILVGGTGVIGAGVEAQLIALGISASRISGSNRFDTSVKVAEMIGTNNGIIVATGSNFPDALSIAPIAAIKSIPVLLSPTNSLDLYVSAFIANKNIPISYVIGGSNVISDSIISGLPYCKRLSGYDRYATNLRIVNEFSLDLNFDTVYLATGSNFPDALSGSALAAKNNAPIILTGKDTISEDAINLIKSKNVKHVVILGGTNVISQNVESAVAEALANN